MRARSASAAVAEFDLMAPEEDDPRLMMSMLAGMLKGNMEYVTA
jgi:hypothetical protein